MHVVLDEDAEHERHAGRPRPAQRRSAAPELPAEQCPADAAVADVGVDVAEEQRLPGP